MKIIIALHPTHINLFYLAYGTVREKKIYVWVYSNSQDCGELIASTTLIDLLFLIIYIHTGNPFTVLSVKLYSFGFGGNKISLCSPGWTETLFGVQIGLEFTAASLPQAPGYVAGAIMPHLRAKGSRQEHGVSPWLQPHSSVGFTSHLQPWIFRVSYFGA